MLWSLFALLIFLFFIIVFSIVFLPTIIEVLINGAIIYFIFLKASADITKRNKLNIYVISALISLIFLVLAGNMFPLWWFTTFSVLTMFIAVLIFIIKTKKSIKD